MLEDADTFMLGVADPFMLATTSVARASAVELEKLETLEKKARNEKNVAHLRKKPAYSWRFKRKDVYLQR